ncbi:hypothetical protein CPB83DRAFT_853393 [Crepidotus variabilis]|uniref:Uncharacterized protein n=1 Tax=Crepidotus variabilis TaxID=179855 RepID=A0A9P6EHD1_9AGAR|nr:hypothetical protein CPB83DRAFT_853393 [Crepidotus variabilis]
MQTYAAKIWHLRLKPGKELIASHTLFRLLSLCNKDKSLFPALKTVIISMPSGFISQDTDFQSLNSVFLAITSPSLSALSITDITFSTEDFATSVLTAASVDCIEINQITLQGHLTIKSLEIIPQFLQLRNINLRLFNCVLPSAVLLQLGSALVHLKSINLSLDDSTFDTTTIPTTVVAPTNFNGLESMELKGSSVEIARFLGIVRPNQGTSPLQAIRLNFPSHWNTGGQEAVAVCIQECGRISPSSLRLLQMRGGRGLTLARGSLSPLAHCEKLETLDIRDVTVSLVDDDIQDICAAGRWNTLQTLRLPNSPDGQAPSLFSIRQLSDSCSNLHTLSISSDFRLCEYQVLQEAILDPFNDNNLQSLTILDVLTVERAVVMPNTMMLAIAVSRFLEHHFRRLVSMEYAGSRSNEWWTGVRTNMIQYRNIRAEMISITSQDQEGTTSN